MKGIVCAGIFSAIVFVLFFVFGFLLFNIESDIPKVGHRYLETLDEDENDVPESNKMVLAKATTPKNQLRRRDNLKVHKSTPIPPWDDHLIVENTGSPPATMSIRTDLNSLIHMPNDNASATIKKAQRRSANDDNFAVDDFEGPIILSITDEEGSSIEIKLNRRKQIKRTHNRRKHNRPVKTKSYNLLVYLDDKALNQTLDGNTSINLSDILNKKTFDTSTEINSTEAIIVKDDMNITVSDFKSMENDDIQNITVANNESFIFNDQTTELYVLQSDILVENSTEDMQLLKNASQKMDLDTDIDNTTMNQFVSNEKFDEEYVTKDNDTNNNEDFNLIDIESVLKERIDFNKSLIDTETNITNFLTVVNDKYVNEYIVANDNDSPSTEVT